MAAFIGRRLLALPPLLLIISMLVFGLSVIIPGDPARTLAGLNAQQAQVDKIRIQLGLNKPIVVQYWDWLIHALHGNLGNSIVANSPVVTELRQRFPVTLSMAAGGLVVIILIGVPLGLLAGTRPGSIRDRSATVVTSTFISIPDFWLAMVLVVLFAVKLHVLPAIGYVGIIRPRFNGPHTSTYRGSRSGWRAERLSHGSSGSSMIDVLDQDYIRTAEAKGLKRRSIIFKHALKNASTVPLTLVGLQFAYLLGGTIILETIFSMPGLGQYFYNALLAKDLPVIQGVTLVYALTFVVMNLIVDVLYGVINPRVRLG